MADRQPDTRQPGTRQPDTRQPDDRQPGDRVTAWRPGVPGVHEVFHARFARHAYPLHTHACWTLLIVDAGAVRYGLGGREHAALRDRITLLPPHVPHDGRPAAPGGFTKRVLYLDGTVLDDDLAGRAVDGPTLADPLLRDRIGRLHDVLRRPEPLEAAGRLALVGERLAQHLRGLPMSSTAGVAAGTRDPAVARRLRDLLDASLPDGVVLTEVAARFGVTPTHLVRAFGRAYGVPPHRYLTGRRVELARRLLLAGEPAAQVATLAGFADQSHLTRHFRATLGTTPARYARSASARA